MTEENGSSEGTKKYRVIDRRPKYDDDPAPAEEQAPAPPAPEPPAQPAPQPPQSEAEPGAAEDGEEPRTVQIEDLVALTLNLLRDQAVVSLGMHFTAGPHTRPDADQAQKAAALYREFANQYDDVVQMFIPEEYKQQPPPPSDLISTLAMAINLVQSQALIQMGLIADPSSGLVIKDMPQAQKTIDFLAVMLEKFKAHLPASAVTSVQGALSDLRVNYVNQLKTP